MFCDLIIYWLIQQTLTGLDAHSWFIVMAENKMWSEENVILLMIFPLHCEINLSHIACFLIQYCAALIEIFFMSLKRLVLF